MDCIYPQPAAKRPTSGRRQEVFSAGKSWLHQTQLLGQAPQHIKPPALAYTLILMILAFAIWKMIARSDQWFSICALQSFNGFRVAIWGPPRGEDRLCFDLIFILEFAQRFLRFKKVQAGENNWIKSSVRLLLSLLVCEMYCHSHDSHFIILKRLNLILIYCICLGA